MGRESATEARRLSPGVWVKKFIVYVLGLFILALGVSISARTGMGISPTNALPYVISQVSGVEQGVIVALIFCLYVFVQFLLLRRDFPPVSLLQIPMSILFGSLVSLTNRLVAWMELDAYILRFCTTGVNVLILSLGIALYILADIVPLSAEGLVLVLEKKTGRPFSRLKMAFDCTMVLLGLIIGLVVTGGVIGLREGTVITALLLGPAIGMYRRRLGGVVSRFILRG